MHRMIGALQQVWLLQKRLLPAKYLQRNQYRIGDWTIYWQDLQDNIRKILCDFLPVLQYLEKDRQQFQVSTFISSTDIITVRNVVAAK